MPANASLVNVSTSCIVAFSRGGLLARMLLEQRLKSTLRHTDVLVSLLAPDSYDERPGSAFQNGIAGRARQLAAEADVKLIQWRSESMLLPSDRRVADRFRTTDTETCLPFELTRDVVATAEARFEPRPPKAADNSAGEDRDNRKRTVLGVPPDDDQFPREIADTLKLNQIRCDSLGKWENLMKRLTQGKSPYDALIVILNGDRAWRDECEVWLDQLETNHSDRLPPIGAYCHRAENRGEAGPVPFDLAQFQEYFGKNDLPKLAKRINAARGGEL